MCTVVVAESEIKTPRELAEWLGINVEKLAPRAEDRKPWAIWEDSCLCQTDVRHVLDRHGIYSRRDECGDLYVVRGATREDQS